ncbi:hypothetical protein [Streptomyces sp. ALI-76-A]|jgi:hypothetical protein|uniref:hypothetical protein n=1 Tax=Streptomyces sp. ALI-76-A TaxID=3025736 RepID=UPI00256F5E2C|nr:hypothetical protein [Streptomyces sp. ALI-76-A]MDL5199056.1 hypothetical protein [Streptomyces sp. ALI-76-A]
MEQGGDLSERDQPAVAAIRGRILLHTRTVEAAALATHICDGTVLCGAGALGDVKDALRQVGTVPVLADPAHYENHFATASESFYVRPRPDTAGLLALPHDIDRPGRDQLAAGAAAALTPTRYFAADDDVAVSAATRRLKRLDDSQVIFTVPLAAGWLRSDKSVRFLIDALNRVPHVKALAFGSAGNPLSDRSSARRLRGLIDNINHVALIRTGLAGLDAYTRGAAFVSIGVQNSCRAFRPPDAVGRPDANRSGRPKSYVLHPDLMQYYRPDKLAHLYGFTTPPACDCTVCDGQSLTRFSDDRDDVRAAEQHNLAVWLPWAEELRAASPRERRHLWSARCYAAIEAHERASLLWRSRRDPGPPADLSLWATGAD